MTQVPAACDVPKGSCDVSVMTISVSAPSRFVTAPNSSEAGARLLAPARISAGPLWPSWPPATAQPRARGNPHAATTYPSKPGAAASGIVYTDPGGISPVAIGDGAPLP